MAEEEVTVHELSERELQIARKLAEVKTIKEIATELGASERVIKANLDRLRLKLGVKRSRDIPRVLKELGVI